MLHARRGIHPRARPDRRPAARLPASSPAAPTRRASGTSCASSATRSRRSTSTTDCAATESEEDARFCRETLRRRGGVAKKQSVAWRDGGGAARAPVRLRDRSPARDGSHRVRPGRDRAARARRIGLAARGSRRSARTASCGRCSASGARRRVPTATSAAWRYREDSSNAGTKRGLIRDEILPLLEQLDPRARTSLLSLADERPTAAAHARAHARRPPLGAAGTKSADLGGGVRAVREYDTLRLEGSVEWGPWTIESDRPGLEVRARRPGDRLAGRRKKVQDLFVDAKVPRAERDDWPLVVAGDRGGRGAGHRRGARLGRSGDVEAIGVDEAVGEILIEADVLQARIAEARRGDLTGVRRAGPAARRRAQGRGVLHGRPDARADRPVRDRLHGDLELRRRHRLVRRRPDPQGPRRQHRRPRRARRRGHHRLGSHALLPDAQPQSAQAGLARDLRAADEAGRGGRSTCRSSSSASRSRTGS